MLKYNFSTPEHICIIYKKDEYDYWRVATNFDGAEVEFPLIYALYPYMRHKIPLSDEGLKYVNAEIIDFTILADPWRGNITLENGRNLLTNFYRRS